MKSELLKLCLLVLVSTGITVIMEPRAEHVPLDNPGHSHGFNEVFGMCLSKKEYGTFECVNRAILSALQSLNDKDSLEFGKVRLDRAEGYGRDLLDLDYDPKDFGNVVKAAARLMERRNFKWNLDNLYPGLQMRVGPMLNGEGMLEFVLIERTASYSDRQAGPGKQLARHVLLPFLLGFKFNLASLIPLMFGFLMIVTKKALLLTKVALFVSGLLGWNTLFAGASAPHPPSGFNGFHTYAHEIPIDTHYYHDHYFPHRPYRTLQPSEFSPYDQHVIREVVNVYDGSGDLEQGKQNPKNFAWTKNI
ncbi:hypothetical protein EAI_15236 [Harpegnathos saltator]|uniref:Osiris 10 n=1 Tax=Harpegnathos saltator TaxID=610380 RepID=E2B2W8_HARSA|nr:hypothetical protein EAI_15236 [Harpegnathos saltator]